MKISGKKLKSMAVLLVMIAGFTASATAVSSSDVAVDIKQPEAGAEQSAESIMGGGVDYELVLSNNMASNSTTVDTLVKVTGENGTVTTKWVNDTNVASSSEKTLDGVLSVSDYNLPNDATFTVEATFTDDSTGGTATVTKSNQFTMVKGLTVAMFMSIVTLLILMSVLFGIGDKI